jgi:hypothetical protein
LSGSGGGRLEEARSWLATRGWNAVGKPVSLDEGMSLDGRSADGLVEPVAET